MLSEKMFINLCDDVKYIKKELEYNKEIIRGMKVNTDKMSGHIDFVENVYDTVKSPMYYILNKVSQIRNITDTSYKNKNNKKLLDK